jgi:hypothetical protein
VPEIRCPYCCDVDHFAAARNNPPGETIQVILGTFGKKWNTPANAKKVLAPPSFVYKPFTAVAHGEYWLVTIDDSFFPTGYKGFKIEVLGMDFKEIPLITVPPSIPLLLSSNAGGQLQRAFLSCRITKKRAGAEVLIHYWPSHSEIITIKGFPIEYGLGEPFAIVQEGLKLFRTLDRSTAHRPRQSEAKKKAKIAAHKAVLLDAMCNLYGGIYSNSRKKREAPKETWKEVANNIGKTEKTVRGWVREGGWSFEYLLRQALH